MDKPLLVSTSANLPQTLLAAKPAWRKTFANAKAEVSASLLSAINTILGSVALSAVLFGPKELNHATGIGLRQCLVGVVAVELVVAAFSKYTIMICPAGGEAVANLTHMVQLCIGAYSANSAALEANVLWSFVFTSFLAGLVLLVIGQLQCGSLANYVPLTVRVGMFAGIGYVMLSLAFGIAADVWVNLSDLNGLRQLLTVDSLIHWMPAVVLGWALDRTFANYWDAKWSPFIFPAFFIGGAILFNVVLAFSGVSLSTALDHGWTQAPIAPEPFWKLYQHMSPSLVDLELMKACLPDMVVAVVIGPLLNIAVNVVLLEELLEETCHLDHELSVHGAGLLTCATVGGFHAFVSVSDTNNHKALGGKSKVSLVMYAGFVSVFLLVPSASKLVQYIPKPLIGALFVSFGIDLLRDCAHKLRQQDGKLEKFVTFSVFLICVFGSMAAGLQYGTLLAFVLEVYEESVLSPIDTVCTNLQLRSAVIRSVAEDRFLSIFGARTVIVRVGSDVLFFANVGTVSRAVLDSSEVSPTPIQVRTVVLDLSSVKRFDCSALAALSALCKGMRSKGQLLIITGLADSVKAEFVQFGVALESPSLEFGNSGGILFTKTFFDGLEAAENAALRSSPCMAAWAAKRNALLDNFYARHIAKLTSLHGALQTNGVPRKDYAPVFAFGTCGHCTLLRLISGELLFSRDQRRKGIYLLVSGEVTLDVGMVTLKLTVPGALIGAVGVLGLPSARDAARAAPMSHGEAVVILHISDSDLAAMAAEGIDGSASVSAITRLCLRGLQQRADLVQYLYASSGSRSCHGLFQRQERASAFPGPNQADDEDFTTRADRCLSVLSDYQRASSFIELSSTPRGVHRRRTHRFASSGY